MDYQGEAGIIGFLGIILLVSILVGLGGLKVLRGGRERSTRTEKYFIDYEPAVSEAPLEGIGDHKGTASKPEKTIAAPTAISK